ncbi:MAG: hypothetical protein ACKVU2_06110 [Saprospiraceae bacterium]
MKNETATRGLLFLAGAAAGLVAGIYLTSEKGTGLRDRLGGQFEGLLRNLEEMADDQVGDFLSQMSTVLEKGAVTFDNLEAVASDSARDMLDEAEADFENGMEKARARLLKKFAEAGLKS